MKVSVCIYQRVLCEVKVAQRSVRGHCRVQGNRSEREGSIVRSSYKTLERKKTIMKLAETAEQIAYVG